MTATLQPTVQRWVAAAAFSAALGASAAHATGIALAGGFGSETFALGPSVIWDVATPLWESDRRRVTGQLEFDAMWLRARSSDGYGSRNLAVVGLTPVARIEWPQEMPPVFIELGIGVHLLSHTTLKNDRQFGSAFQFGELLGAGFRFGPGNAYEIGLRLEHLSNGGINAHNAGITFGVVRAAYNF